MDALASNVLGREIATVDMRAEDATEGGSRHLLNGLPLKLSRGLKFDRLRCDKDSEVLASSFR